MPDPKPVNERPVFTLGKTLQGHRWIQCHLCGSTSYNPHDVDERFCGRCKLFLEDVLRGLVPWPGDAP